jgi:hypothetical protein
MVWWNEGEYWGVGGTEGLRVRRNEGVLGGGEDDGNVGAGGSVCVKLGEGGGETKLSPRTRFPLIKMIN